MADLKLTRAHVREAMDLLFEVGIARVNFASFLGTARCKTHIRGRLTPARSPGGEFRVGGPSLPILARYILTEQALGEDGGMGFFARAVRATEPGKPGCPEP